MKKCLKTWLIFTVLLIVVLNTGFGSAVSFENSGYKLVLRTPRNVTIPAKSLRCLYKGLELFIEKNHCILPEESYKPFFNIIITPEIACQKTNSPGTLYRKKSLPYKWYSCFLQLTENTKVHTWQVHELDQNRAPLRIPEHSSIVLLTNPDLIEKIEPFYKAGTHLVHLPTVIMRNCTTQSMLQESLDEAALSWLEVKQEHKEVSRKTKKHNDSVFITR